MLGRDGLLRAADGNLQIGRPARLLEPPAGAVHVLVPALRAGDRHGDVVGVIGDGADSVCLCGFTNEWQE
jgi:hypothetical protein